MEWRRKPEVDHYMVIRLINISMVKKYGENKRNDHWIQDDIIFNNELGLLLWTWNNLIRRLNIRWKDIWIPQINWRYSLRWKFNFNEKLQHMSEIEFGYPIRFNGWFNLWTLRLHEFEVKNSWVVYIQRWKEELRGNSSFLNA